MLVGLLSISMTQTQTPKPVISLPQGEPIKAVTVDQTAVDQHVKRLQAEQDKKRLAERKRIEELEKRLKRAENRRKAEEQRLKKLELERKRKQREKERAEEAARKAKLKQKEEAKRAAKAEADRKQKEAQRKRAEAERIKAEKAAAEAKKKREREEAERQRKAKAAKEQAELERMMEAEMAAENQQIGAQRQAQILSEQQKYTSLIKATIQRHWLVDDLMAGKTCVLNIKLAQDGFVVSVNSGKGDPLVCNSARKAVQKAGTLPMSSDPEVNRKMRDIDLVVEPEL